MSKQGKLSTIRLNKTKSLYSTVFVLGILLLFPLGTSIAKEISPKRLDSDFLRHISRNTPNLVEIGNDSVKLIFHRDINLHDYIKGARDISLINCIFTGKVRLMDNDVPIYGIEDEGIKSLFIRSCCFRKGLDISADIDTVDFMDDTINSNCHLGDDSIRYFRIWYSYLDNIDIIGNCKGKLILASNEIAGSVGLGWGTGGTVNVTLCTMKNFTFENGFPDTLNFLYSKIENQLDLIGIIPPTRGIRASFDLSWTEYEKVLIDYKMLKLHFFNDINYDEKCSIFERLLERIKSAGFLDSYKQLDLEYKHFKYINEHKPITDWLQRKWWNYGYNKELIVRNALILLLVFSLINLFWFKYLLFEVYSMQSITVKYSESNGKPFVRFLNNLLLCLIYTSFVFVGLKIDIEKMKFKNIWAACYVLFIYLVGLICTGFMINFILNK
jgi:hypothetical protein